MLAENDNVLHGHLYQPRARNATYLSSRSHNEIINIIGCDIISAKIISELKEARFYSVLVDEVSSHNVEHLPLCLRFVDAKSEIQEVCGFLKNKGNRHCGCHCLIIKIITWPWI